MSRRVSHLSSCPHAIRFDVGLFHVLMNAFLKHPSDTHPQWPVAAGHSPVPSGFWLYYGAILHCVRQSILSTATVWSCPYKWARSWQRSVGCPRLEVCTVRPWQHGLSGHVPAWIVWHHPWYLRFLQVESPQYRGLCWIGSCCIGRCRMLVTVGPILSGHRMIDRCHIRQSLCGYIDPDVW